MTDNGPTDKVAEVARLVCADCHRPVYRDVSTFGVWHYHVNDDDHPANPVWEVPATIGGYLVTIL